MTILSGDIKLLASKIMDDVPNGGGGPTGKAITDGASNAIFGDVTERQRAVGGVSIRQLFGAVQTPSTDAYMDPTVVLSQLPNDPNVSITLAKTSMFARRTEMANAIENYLIASSEWAGFLFENHVAGQRSIQIFQRPGTPLPSIGRTLVLVQNDGLPSQVLQYVRITKMEEVTRTFTETDGSGKSVEFKASVATCDLSDVLRSNFSGSPPNSKFSREKTKAVVRDTSVANAATFFGAAALTTEGSIGDSLLRVSSVYTQLVPSARTESVALDQKPAAQRTLTLAQSPRLIEVGVTPHTMRIRVGQENRGFSWVQMLKPRPAPGTIVISYMALGNWYTLTDDGLGGFTGSGVGQVVYTTGSLSITLPSIPDAGTSIIFQWGENTAYTNRAGQAGYRAPEFAWALPQSPVKPGSVVVKWMSGGALKTATDSGTGGFTSASASGEINYPAGKIFLRPTAMIDAGGEFSVDYEYGSTRTENFNAPTVDSGGFGSLTLSEAPAPKSVSVKWITTRTVSASSGASEIVSSTGNATITPPVTVAVGTVPGASSGNHLFVSSDYIISGNALSVTLSIAAPQTPGTYTWELAGLPEGFNGALVVQGGATSGTFVVGASQQSLGGGGAMGVIAAGYGKFSLTIASDCPDLSFHINVKNQALTTVAVSRTVTVDTVSVQPPPAWPPVLPDPAIVVPTDAAPEPVPVMAYAGVTEAGARVYVKSSPRNVAVFGASYDPPEVNGLVPIVWTAGDLATKEKLITSQSGVPIYYALWV